MKAPAIARFLGIAFLFAGALGFVPLVTPAAPLTAEYVTLGGNYGMLFGIFPVNNAHDVLHIFLGCWGILASFNFKPSVWYLRISSIFYLLLVPLGLIPITSTLFGAVPIYGFDALLHLLVGLFALYGGFGAGSLAGPSREDFVGA